MLPSSLNDYVEEGDHFRGQKKMCHRTNNRLVGPLYLMTRKERKRPPIASTDLIAQRFRADPSVTSHPAAALITPSQNLFNPSTFALVG